VHILLALADDDRHGYGIMQEVARLTDGQVRMGPGTLYGTIKRMLAAGFIEEADERPDPELDDERRRYYRMTTQGRRALRNETMRVATLVSAARAKKVYP
jgi:DNA-binding PadR family transcriptional regulator